MKDFKKKIRNIPDFPKKGIVFRDISPLLEDKDYFKEAISFLVKSVGKDKIDKVVGIDARGFILAGVMAEKLNAGMVMVRKAGKLPYKTEVVEYDLEYGKEVLEIQKDSIKPGEKILLVDDVLATGGSMSAAVRLVEKLGGEVVKIVFLIVLDYLPGRKVLGKYNLISLVDYQK
jgi:adenine phosphoribosyltransferase